MQFDKKQTVSRQGIDIVQRKKDSYRRITGWGTLFNSSNGDRMGLFQSVTQKIAMGAIIAGVVLLPTGCDREPSAPVVKEPDLVPLKKKSDVTPEQAKAIITSRKPTITTRSVPEPSGKLVYSMDDGEPIANEVGILEGQLNGDKVELLFRIDPSGTTVDRVTVDVNGEQIYAVNYAYNTDGTPSEVTQTVYYHETAGPTTREIGDIYGWQPADMKSPLGSKLSLSITRHLAPRFANSAAFTDGCTEADVASLGRFIINVMTARNVSNAQQAAASATNSAAGLLSMKACFTWIMQGGVTVAEYSTSTLMQQLAIAGVPIAFNSFQTATRVWDRLGRWSNTGSSLINDIVNTWNKAHAGDCNASSSGRACTSLLYYLML